MNDESERTARELADELAALPDAAGVPASILLALARWVLFGRMGGGFVEAVLRSNLCDAAMRADSENARALGAIGAFVGRALPRSCWGDGVDTWEGAPNWRP